MGNAAISQRTLENSIENTDRNVAIQYNLRFSFASMLTKTAIDYIGINASLSRACVASWNRIVARQSFASSGVRISGVVHFVSIFLDELTGLDTDGRVLKKLQSRNPVRKFHYERLIIILVMEFVLSIHDESFDTKARIRTLGRSHARHGIREPEFRIFNDAIIRTFLRLLEPEALPGVVEAWTILLDFVTEQLTIDNVTFVSHHTVTTGQAHIASLTPADVAEIDRVEIFCFEDEGTSSLLVQGIEQYPAIFPSPSLSLSSPSPSSLSLSSPSPSLLLVSSPPTLPPLIVML